MKTLLSCLAAITLTATASHAQKILDDLTSSQLTDLKAGKQVVTTKDVSSGPWPTIRVYTLVNAPVSAVDDVFRDYANAQDYIPNLVSAKIVAHPSPDIYDVSYTSRMPIIGATTDTVRNWYSYPKSGGVKVDWNLLSSKLADISTGQLRVEAYGTGSVLRYTNYVKPKSSLAGLAKNAALDAVKKTVAAIKQQAETVAKQTPAQ